MTRTARRSVKAVSVKLAAEQPELRLRIVTDFADDARLRAPRAYHSLWPLTGRHEVRPPLLPPNPPVELGGSRRLLARPGCRAAGLVTRHAMSRRTFSAGGPGLCHLPRAPHLIKIAHAYEDDLNPPGGRSGRAHVACRRRAGARTRQLRRVWRQRRWPGDHARPALRRHCIGRGLEQPSGVPNACGPSRAGSFVRAAPVVVAVARQR
jgi:hypothetical protein